MYDNLDFLYARMSREFATTISECCKQTFSYSARHTHFATA